jgi:hypothetical protein
VAGSDPAALTSPQLELSSRTEKSNICNDFAALHLDVAMQHEKARHTPTTSVDIDIAAQQKKYLIVTQFCA